MSCKGEGDGCGKSKGFQHVSCPEEVRRVEERSEVEEVMIVGEETPDDAPCQQRDPDILHVKKVDVVAFIALAINCTVQTERK